MFPKNCKGVGNKVVSLGGLDGKCRYGNTIEMFDIYEKKWTESELKLPGKMIDFSVVICGESVFCLGGRLDEPWGSSSVFATPLAMFR